MGQLTPISGADQRTGSKYEHFAFVPEPLPATLALASATWTAAARTEGALARLDQAAQQMPEPGLLRRAALRREAQSTSALEGTFAPFEDVLEPELEERAQLSVELLEILNYVAAAEVGFEAVTDRSLTSGLISELQGILVQGTPDEHSDSGGVRNRQVVIGPRDAPVVESRFVPPPPGQLLRAAFEHWVDWVREPPSDLPRVIRTAMAHYQFETLHPFSDGNGRIGRLLIGLQLMRDGLLGEPILVVSPWFEARRREYQDGLLELSRTGDWDAWIQFFAAGVAASADGFRDQIDQLIAWRDDALQKVREAGISGVAVRLAGDLIGTPVLSTPSVVRNHNISPQGAMNAIKRLAELGLVQERPIRGRRKTFVANEVVALLGR
jgi:Fic family protein